MGFIKKCVSYLAGSMLIQVVLIFVSIYLLMVVLPNYIGCILPEKMCMSRTDDGDDVNDVLAITAALIPSLLVVYGYKIWRSQKAKELLATKAQDIYFELDKLDVVLSNHKELIETTPEQITRESVVYAEVKAECNDLVKKMKLFKDLLEDENSLHYLNFEGFYNRLNMFDRNLKASNDIKPFVNSSLIKAIDYHNGVVEAVNISSLPKLMKDIKSHLVKVILHK